MPGVQCSFRVLRAAIVAAWFALLVTTASHGAEQTVAQLKERLASASPGDRPRICIQIAQTQLAEADKLYAAGDFEKAQTALTDVAAYSELARDYAIQSRKYQKQSEIAVRGMTRKLNDIQHTLSVEDRTPLQDAITRLERVRDDLLAAIFPKGAK